MNVKQVRERVAYIAKIQSDDEAAHGSEDELHRDVLRTIANGNKDARALAREALKTRDIDFSRWYA